MHWLTSLPDQLLRVTAIILQMLILFIVEYVPVASRLWMLRIYLLYSLFRALLLVIFEVFTDVSVWRQAYGVLQIGGHIILMLFAVELMGILLSGPRKALGIFYSLSSAVVIFIVLSVTSFPTSTDELAYFTQRAVVLSLFLLVFVCAAHPLWEWPYLGIATGLSIMLSLDMGCMILQRWSIAHNFQHYSIVHYAFPISSVIGYLIWACVCLHPTSVSPVSRQEALQDLLSATKLKEMNEALKEFIRR